jgi:uncharacterized protein YcnI
MKRLVFIFVSSLVSLLKIAGIASAHVSVLPGEVNQSAYEKFTVRVPNEKEIPSVKIEVKFAVNDVTISRFEPKLGWKYESEIKLL